MVEEGKDPSVVILDVPRDSENYLQYLTVEILKDGLVNSGKYKSIKVTIQAFHIFLFTNFRVYWKMDIHKDAGVITDINDNVRNIYGEIIQQVSVVEEKKPWSINDIETQWRNMKIENETLEEIIKRKDEEMKLRDRDKKIEEFLNETDNKDNIVKEINF